LSGTLAGCGGDGQFGVRVKRENPRQFRTGVAARTNHGDFQFLILGMGI
jgi:hypothetical protein